MELAFKTYVVAEHNPFERFPKGVMVAAEADEEGMYTVHVQLINGLGLSTLTKHTLAEANELVGRYSKGLGYPENAWYIDIPAHVLEQDNFFNRRLKQEMLKSRQYFKLHGIKQRNKSRVTGDEDYGK
ncbi:hypothetical protein [Brevibacillus reuszeri]|uniref:hypothetical protein n=1 Tax=Brevibacillus reuszeri TaxID=54915 RepID=UPI000CCC9B36|nr:hypothetical protein [Brevibacillus reuszeri]